ncbi:hypothetical protein [Catellatospora sp. TT07R-123]|uniref:hypothetical protein n=1 Tax=Catellatospora sp. TT07R-123 TaxID=2733863 RepID=UPI001BB3CE4D|nr:hypothetical protein [Catellatospora sp. TT07R-123]
MEKFVDTLLKALSAGSAQGSPGPIGSLLPGRAGSGGGGSSSSRTGGGGARNVSRQVGRGAAAIAGAQALRGGDAATLQELGLDLDHLRSLPSARAQCAYIADAVLGAPSHPDEVALRAATMRTMAEVLKAKEDISLEDRVELFIENLAYEQVLVELTSQRRENTVTPQRAKQIEEDARKYLHAHIAAGRVTEKAKLTVQGFIEFASKLASKTFRVLGIRGSA